MTRGLLQLNYLAEVINNGVKREDNPLEGIKVEVPTRVAPTTSGGNSNYIIEERTTCGSDEDSGEAGDDEVAARGKLVSGLVTG
jgi:hypothetical protein